MKRIVVTLAATMAVGVGLTVFFMTTGAPSKSATRADATPLSAQAVLRINPRSAAPPLTTAPLSTRVESPLTAAYLDRRDYASLQRQLNAMPETAETLYLKARLYGTCAKRPNVSPLPKNEADFVASLPDRDPYRDERIAAWHKNADLCQGVDLPEFSLPTYMAMLERASAAGDPRAQARLLVRQIEQASTQPNTPPGQLAPVRGGFVVTPDQFSSLVSQLNSGDPEVVQLVRGVLSSSIDQGRVVFGPDGDPVNPRAMFSALGLVACDLGRRCGADAAELLSACANLGQCAARNISDYTYYYQVSPSEAQLIEGYRQAIDAAIRAQQAPPFRLTPRGGANTSTFMFGTGSP